MPLSSVVVACTALALPSPAAPQVSEQTLKSISTPDKVETGLGTLEFKDGALQAVLDSQNQLIANDFSNEWGLRSEPWMFAVDRNGVVQGSYLITITDPKLAAILPVITAGG